MNELAELAARDRAGDRRRAEEGDCGALTSSARSPRRTSSELALTPELHDQAESVRYALEGGKRVRAVICLATAEAAGAEAEAALPAAASLELVHAFSLVHDDLPALDNDHERRGRPSTWPSTARRSAVLAGDALLAEAFRLALSYSTPTVARELAQATLGMIGGQYLDIDRGRSDDPERPRAQDGPPLRRVGRLGALGRRRAREGAGALARVRRPARPALPARRRHPGRRRVRPHARRGRCTPFGRRGGRPRTRAARGSARRHDGAARDRRRARDQGTS